MTTLPDLAARMEAQDRAARANERPYLPPEADEYYREAYSTTINTWELSPPLVYPSQLHTGSGER